MLAGTREKFLTCRADFRPRTVLVVDDELLIRWALRHALTNAGFHALEATDAASALDRLACEAQPVDAVLLDYRVPGADGLSLLRSIKQLRPSCLVIMMTAYGTPEMGEEAMSCGAYHVMAKPFGVDEVAKLVATALNDNRT